MANIKDAVRMIDDDTLHRGKIIESSWDYEGAGQGEHPTPPGNFFRLNTNKTDKEVYIRRDVNVFEGGKFSYEVCLVNNSGHGLYFKLGSRDEAFVFIKEKDGFLYTGKKKIAAFGYGDRHIKINVDMVGETFSVQLDGITYGPYDLACKVFPLSCVTIGYGKEDVGSVDIHFVKLYANFLFLDENYRYYEGPMPDDYVIKAPKTTAVHGVFRAPGSDPNPFRCDVTAYAIDAGKGDKVVVSHPFDKAVGKVTMDIKFLQDKKAGKVTLALMKGKTPVISVYDEGEELHCYCGKALRPHHLNVWQTVRVVADTATGKATVYLNGKLTKTVPFENAAGFMDGFAVMYDAKEASRLMFSDIGMWVQPDEPEDYVPKPVIPKRKGDYAVGMNICSLWHEGTHYGWDVISPYDDLKPVIGYYDEGLPEVADWEIKFMAEHAVDYELYCWYNNETCAPIKRPFLYYALHQGHFYAKYSHMVKFAILWEALCCRHIKDFECFKKYTVPYWLDYYFSDDRYMRVNNRAVISIFGAWCLYDDIGSNETIKAAYDYLEEEVKKLGYDGIIRMACHEDPKNLVSRGYDACHAYHWGSAGHKLSVNFERNENFIAQKGVHAIPTMSVGFKNVGWSNTRNPLLTTQDMYTGMKKCAEEYLKLYPKGSWESKMLHLSTWNEYGEGTCMMPNGQNGFGYLDAVRKALCGDIPHVDHVPTENQLKRLSYLRVQSRRWLRRTRYEVRPLPDVETPVATYTFKTGADLENWTLTGITEAKIKGGKLVGKCADGKGRLTLKNAKFDATTIAYAKVEIGNRDAGNGRPAGFTVFVGNKKTGKQRPIGSGCGSNDIRTCTLDLDLCESWAGDIKSFAIMPVANGDFVIKSITFYAAVPHYTLFADDGSQLFYDLYVPMINKQLYVPLNPESGVFEKVLKSKYEWFKDDECLEIWNENDRYTVKVGQAYVTKNGESYDLIRPIFYQDGIPLIAIDDIRRIFGIDYKVKGNRYCFL